MNENANSKYNAFLLASPDAIIIADAKGVILEVSSRAGEIFGFLESELIGKNGFDLVHQEDKANAQKAFEEVINNGHIIQAHFRLYRKNKEYFYSEFNASLMKDEDNKDLVVIIIRDITNQEKEKKELKTLKKQFEDAEQIAKIGSFSYSFENQQWFFSNGVLKILGKDEYKASAGLDFLINNIIEEQREEVRQTILHSLEKSEKISLETHLLAQSGALKVIKIYCERVDDVFVGVISDISKEKLYKQETQERIKELEKIQKVMIGREIIMAEFKEKLKKYEH